LDFDKAIALTFFFPAQDMQIFSVTQLNGVTHTHVTAVVSQPAMTCMQQIQRAPEPACNILLYTCACVYVRACACMCASLSVRVRVCAYVCMHV